MRLERLAEQALLEDVDGVLPTFGTHALITGLRDQLRTRGDRLLDSNDLAQLLNQRLLPVDMLVCPQRPQIDERVIVVGCADDHRIELVGVLVKRLAKIAASEGLGMLLRHRRECIAIDIAQT